MTAKKPPPKLCYSIAEVADATGLGVSTVYKKISAGELEAKKVGARTLIPAESLQSWFAGLPQSAA